MVLKEITLPKKPPLRKILIGFILAYTIAASALFLLLILPPEMPIFPAWVYFYSPIILFSVVRGLLLSRYSDKDLALTATNIIINVFLSISYFKPKTSWEIFSQSERENFHDVLKLSPFVYVGLVDFITNMLMWLTLIGVVVIKLKKHGNFSISGKIYITDRITKISFYLFSTAFILISFVILLEIFKSPIIYYVLVIHVGKKISQVIISLIYIAIFIYTGVNSFLNFALTPEDERKQDFTATDPQNKMD